MHRSKHLIVPLVGLMLVSGVTLALAQDEVEPRAPWHPGNYWGVGAQASFPTSYFNDKYSTGYGVHGLFNYPLVPLIDLSASVGWNHFPGSNATAATDIWEAALGTRFALGAFFMNGEMGYFSKIDEWNFIPGLGVRYDHWEISLRLKAAGSHTWTSLRLGYYF